MKLSHENLPDLLLVKFSVDPETKKGIIEVVSSSSSDDEHVLLEQMSELQIGNEDAIFDIYSSKKFGMSLW